MKKILIGAVALFLMVGCGGNKGSGKGGDGYNRTADSLAQEEAIRQAQEAAQEAIEQAFQDSIMQKQIEEEYKKGLKVTTGKIKSVNGEGTYNELTMPFNVENNTCVTWEANDYYITFRVEEEYQTEEGDLDVKWFNRKANGKTVRPGEKITIIHKDSGWYPKDIKIKTKLSKEEFAERFKENTVFDNQLNKFVVRYQN